MADLNSKYDNLKKEYDKYTENPGTAAEGDIAKGKTAWVNGKLITSNGYEPKDGDIISVRGRGRFRYEGVSRQTKKGRNSVKLLRYQ